jgi:hypothetical protein
MLGNKTQTLQFIKNTINARFLFLDDIRHPLDAFEYTKQTMFLHEKWEIVKNYNEFVKWIVENGLPDFVSFDHDLADRHLWADDEKANEQQTMQVHIEKTGYDCAKWLVDYCLDNNLDWPKFYCHSMNPVGKYNVNSILDQFLFYRSLLKQVEK